MVLALCMSSNEDYIHIKFHEDILNNFQVTEWTRFFDGQKSKGNNSKSINARVMVLALSMSYNVD